MNTIIKRGSDQYPLEFLLIQTSDHLTGAVGVNPEVQIRKKGGDWAAPEGIVSEVGYGWYEVAGNSLDSDTYGPLLLHVEATGCDKYDEKYQVVAFDPQNADNLGIVNLNEGSFSIDARNITLSFIDSNDDPVPNVDFRVVGKGSRTSDGLGVSSFGLEDGVYTILIRPKNGVMFPTTILEVDGNDVDVIIEGTATVLTPAVNPEMCRVFGRLRKLNGALAANVQLIFKRLSSGPYALDDALLGQRVWQLKTDPDGEIDINLPREARITLTAPEVGFNETLLDLTGETLDLRVFGENV